MRSLGPTLLIALCSCADAAREDSPALGVTRQGVLIFPDGGPRVKGNLLNAHMGAAITACPQGGWVAAATGEDSVFLSSLRDRLRPGRTSLFGVEPLPIACLGAGGAQHVLMGGSNNAWAVFPDGGSRQIYGSRVDSFDVLGGFVAVGSTSPGVINVFPYSTTANSLTNPTFTSAPTSTGVGTSISWSQRGDLLVGTATATGGAAGVYFVDANNPDAGRLLASAFNLMNPAGTSGSGYGSVVLVGDVTPDLGEEYVVAAPALGRVYVFSGQFLVQTLMGGPSFGAALAVEPASFGGLHALWVGEPDADQVHRFFGGVAETFDAPPEAVGGSFGAAIAIDQRGVVAIGAPDYDDLLIVLDQAGAVFEAFFDGGTTSGQPAQCVDGQSCDLPGCTTGVCVSGVFCQQTRPLGSDCTATERCASDVCVPAVDASVPFDAGVADAGEPDAGATDAGTDAGTIDAGVDAGEPDAGRPDAGRPDAGAPDAGVDAGVEAPDAGAESPQIFRTCGCTTADLPLLLVALALFRRRLFRITAR